MAASAALAHYWASDDNVPWADFEPINDDAQETVDESVPEEPLVLEPLESPLSRVLALTYPDYHRPVELPYMEFQGEASDCWVCAIAMLTGDDYNTIYDVGLPFYQETGMTFMNLLTVLRRLGHRIRWHHPERFDLAKQGEWARKKVRHRDAIHLVPSLKNFRRSGAHYVTVIDGQVRDPTTATPYTQYDDLESLGVVYLA